MSLRPNDLNQIFSRGFQAAPAPMLTIRSADFHIFLDDLLALVDALSQLFRAVDGVGGNGPRIYVKRLGLRVSIGAGKGVCVFAWSEQGCGGTLSRWLSIDDDGKSRRRRFNCDASLSRA